MLLVAFWVVLATGVGVACDRHAAWSGKAGRAALTLMLYVLLPFVAYVSFAHLELSLGAGVGLVIAYIGLGLAGTCAWWVGRRIGVSGPTLGALICTVMLVNTGYLGLPMVVALLGEHDLSHAVAYDQVISGPMVFTAGFAVGAAFGSRERVGSGPRALNFLTKNPPLIAAITGLLVPAAWAPHVLVTASHVVVDALLVIGFFAVGVYLSSERREDNARLLERPDRQVLVALALRFTINPALLGLVWLAGVGIPTTYLLLSLMPSGVNSLIVGHAYGLDQRLIATMIVWSTLLVLVFGTVAYLV
jgi:predicted permease